MRFVCHQRVIAWLEVIVCKRQLLFPIITKVVPKYRLRMGKLAKLPSFVIERTSFLCSCSC